MRFVSYITVGLLLGLPQSLRSDPVTVNGIAARVNDSIITFQEIASEIEGPIKQLYQEQYGRQSDALNQKIDQLKNDTAELLVERQLILNEFKTGGYQLPESVIDDDIKRQIREGFGDRARMIKSLQAQGMTYENYRQRIREKIIVGAMEMKNAGSEIIISPHKIASYYTNNLDKFKVEDEVKLRMVFLANKPDRDAEATKKLAEDILARIEGGAAFSDMATAYSDGSQRAQGGDWGWTEKKVLRADLAEIAFSLKPGQRSGVIEKPDGCYLMLVEDAHPAHVRTLTEVQGDIERALTTEDRRRLRKQWIDRLKSKAFIRFFPST